MVDGREGIVWDPARRRKLTVGANDDAMADEEGDRQQQKWVLSPKGIDFVNLYYAPAIPAAANAIANVFQRNTVRIRSFWLRPYGLSDENS